MTGGKVKSIGQSISQRTICQQFLQHGGSNERAALWGNDNKEELMT
jgi:hypothetical protein